MASAASRNPRYSGTWFGPILPDLEPANGRRRTNSGSSSSTLWDFADDDFCASLKAQLTTPLAQSSSSAPAKRRLYSIMPAPRDRDAWNGGAGVRSRSALRAYRFDWYHRDAAAAGSAPPLLFFDPDIWDPVHPESFRPPALNEGVHWVSLHGTHTAMRPEHGQLVRVPPALGAGGGQVVPAATYAWPWFRDWVAGVFDWESDADSISYLNLDWDPDEEDEDDYAYFTRNLYGPYGDPLYDWFWEDEGEDDADRYVGGYDSDSDDYESDEEEEGGITAEQANPLNLPPGPSYYGFQFHPTDAWWPLS